MRMISRETMATIYFALRLPWISCIARWGRYISAYPRACRRPLPPAIWENVVLCSCARLDTRYAPGSALGSVLLEPDLPYRNRPIAQKIDLHPLDVGLVQALG